MIGSIGGQIWAKLLVNSTFSARIRASIALDVINGAVVEGAREHGMPAPANAVVALVHSFEDGGASPSATHFARVLDAARQAGAL